MPITPTTSTKKTNTTAYTQNNINFTSTIKNRNLNSQAPTAIDILDTSSEPGHEIEEISKKISEHAEVLYRTWKSRGLAPTQLLEFYANATTPTTTLTTLTTLKPLEQEEKERKKRPTEAEVITATNNFLSNLVSTGNSDAITTEGLQQLVNSFVLKDKEQRAVDAMTGKTTVKMATKTTPTTTTTNKTTAKSTSSVKPIKSAILLKDEEQNSLAPAKVVLKKTIKTTSTPIIATTGATMTTTKTTTTKPITTTTTPINSILIKSKIDNGGSTLQQQSAEAPTTASKLKKSTTKTTTAKNTAKTTLTTLPTTNVDINLNINDLQNLSQFQNDNLLKIKELLEDQSNTTKVHKVKNSTNLTNNDNKNVKIATITTTTTDDQPKIKKSNRIVVAVKKERGNLEGDAIKNSGGSEHLMPNVIDGVSEIDGKTIAASLTTKTTAKTTKSSKLNKNNQAMLINQMDDDIIDKKSIANNNNTNITTKKIKSKQIKSATTTTTTPILITTTTTTTPLTTIKSIEKIDTSSTASGAAETVTTSSTSKETNGNSSDVSVISGDSGRTKTRTKITNTITNHNNKETKEKLNKINNNSNSNNNNHKVKVKEQENIKTDNSEKKLEDQPQQQQQQQEKEQEQNNNNNISNKNMALVRSNSTSSMPTGSAKMKTARSNSLTNGNEKPVTSRPFLTRGSVAERVMMFEKCPDARNSFLNIKRPDPAEAPPKSLLKVKLHATPPPPPDQNSLQKEIRSLKSVYIPRFYFPHGKPQPQIAMERTLRGILSAFDSFPNNQVTKDELPRILKICGLPFYWRMPILLLCQQGNSGLVERTRFVDFWKQMNIYCHDGASRFVYIMSRGQRYRSYILPEDLAPLVQDVVDTHPGLAFLKEATEFHSRYVHTVIARIFYSVNRSWSGKISISELKKSDLVEIMNLLEEEDDINQIMAFFSYEHFYVIYCKFWELDKDHDLLINQEDLARHSDHALSTRIIERIFSGCVTRNDNKKSTEDEPKMSYTDFVWFLLSEEDKRTPTAIEYWFRCMDIDGDGVLSMYELEYFYEEQQQRMESIGIECLPFEDCLCQMLDMIKPARRDCVTLSDLKHSKMTHVFFDTFFNLEKYLDHEQRDPFASQRDEYGSDWDRFAAQEYELLITEENA